MDISRDKLTKSHTRRPGHGNLKRQTESLLIIKTNYIKTKIDNTQQNSKSKLCGYKDKAINPKIRECSKLAQKEYKTRHDWMGKVVHRKLCKTVNFDKTTGGFCRPADHREKMKEIEKEISNWTLPENKNWKIWKSEDESRPSRLPNK